MPIYEYQCCFCGHRLEQLQKFGDEPLTRCPNCGKEGLKRCVSLSGFQLKGSGWYETDFKKTHAPKTENESTEKKLDEKKTVEKTETKEEGEKK